VRRVGTRFISRDQLIQLGSLETVTLKRIRNQSVNVEKSRGTASKRHTYGSPIRLAELLNANGHILLPDPRAKCRIFPVQRGHDFHSNIACGALGGGGDARGVGAEAGADNGGGLLLEDELKDGRDFTIDKICAL
jgi:hypothetical protein